MTLDSSSDMTQGKTIPPKTNFGAQWGIFIEIKRKITRFRLRKERLLLSLTIKHTYTQIYT